MDHLTKEQRHKNMVANKSKGTKIELLLASVLWNSGIRYRKNDKGIPGTPDFTLRGYKIAIFCDGDFWHGKDWEINKEKIKSNRSFWYAKIEHNIIHDKEITEQLQNQGWKVFRFWETDIRKNPDSLVDQVLSYIHQRQKDKSKIILNKITEEQKIPVQMQLGQQLSIVSHYLYNQEQPSVQSFEQPAKVIISQLYDLNENNTSIDALIAEPEIQYSLGSNLHTAPFLPDATTTFTFVDLFAGIGGIRLALQELGGRCIFCSEIDPDAQHTYLLNFGEAPFGDITDEATKCLIPDTFDLLCASIPAQRFLHAKKGEGLNKLRGTLFYHFSDILNRKRPKAFLLETDGKFLTFDKGTNINTFLNSIKEVTGYNMSYTMMKGRTYIIGTRNNLGVTNIVFPTFPIGNIPNTKESNPKQIAQFKGFPNHFIMRMKKQKALKLLKAASPPSSIKAIGEILIDAIKRINLQNV